ncbi:unnamed protein product [Amoebophrya sp. A120]|nr:unnamed protein product [Amoebophrya sp. A120]|eukprot:GSA120T00006382001.1
MLVVHTNSQKLRAVVALRLRDQARPRLFSLKSAAPATALQSHLGPTSASGSATSTHVLHAAASTGAASQPSLRKPLVGTGSSSSSTSSIRSSAGDSTNKEGVDRAASFYTTNGSADLAYRAGLVGREDENVFDHNRSVRFRHCRKAKTVDVVQQVDGLILRTYRLQTAKPHDRHRTTSARTSSGAADSILAGETATPAPPLLSYEDFRDFVHRIFPGLPERKVAYTARGGHHGWNQWVKDLEDSGWSLPDYVPWKSPAKAYGNQIDWPDLLSYVPAETGTTTGLKKVKKKASAATRSTIPDRSDNVTSGQKTKERTVDIEDNFPPTDVEGDAAASGGEARKAKAEKKATSSGMSLKALLSQAADEEFGGSEKALKETRKKKKKAPPVKAVLPPRELYNPIASPEVRKRLEEKLSGKGITLVLDHADAERVLRILEKQGDRPHFWDTESKDIQLGRLRSPQSPLHHGELIVASCWVGDDVDFGNGPRLFIDNYHSKLLGDGSPFKEYFENPQYRKVFHNFAYDYKVLLRAGIQLQGFYADTLHLARLQDSSLANWEQDVRFLDECNERTNEGLFLENESSLRDQLMENLMSSGVSEERDDFSDYEFTTGGSTSSFSSTRGGGSSASTGCSNSKPNAAGLGGEAQDEQGAPETASAAVVSPEFQESLRRAVQEKDFVLMGNLVQLARTGEMLEMLDAGLVELSAAAVTSASGLKRKGKNKSDKAKSRSSSRSTSTSSETTTGHAMSANVAAERVSALKDQLAMRKRLVEHFQSVDDCDTIDALNKLRRRWERYLLQSEQDVETTEQSIMAAAEQTDRQDLGGGQVALTQLVGDAGREALEYLEKKMERLRHKTKEKGKMRGYGLKHLVRVFDVESHPKFLQDLVLGIPRQRKVQKSEQVEFLHTDEYSFPQWVEYATSDARYTGLLFHELRKKLTAEDWSTDILQRGSSPQGFTSMRSNSFSARDQISEEEDDDLQIAHANAAASRGSFRAKQHRGRRGISSWNDSKGQHGLWRGAASSGPQSLHSRNRSSAASSQHAGAAVKSSFRTPPGAAPERRSAAFQHFLRSRNMWVFYENYYQKFGQLLNEMEVLGVPIDIEHLERVEQQATLDVEKYRKEVNDWIQEHLPAMKRPDLLNLGSPEQLRVFLYGNYCPRVGQRGQAVRNQRDRTKMVPPKREFTIEVLQEGDECSSPSETAVGTTSLEEDTASNSTTREEIGTHGGSTQDQDAPAPSAGRPKTKTKETFLVCGLNLRPVRHDREFIGQGGWPKTCRASLERLRDQCANHYYESERAKAPLLEALMKAKQAQSMLAYFIKPLKALASDSRGRIHPSLMLDTSTGRLACRAPNLQNQPALDKDVYQIRRAVRASENKCLVVCDFSQLELRVFAHETNCKSMLEKFESGGDFHSETAAEMYPQEIGEPLRKKEISNEDIKEKFGDKRKAAKTMNFGIAYGRSAFSIGKELDVSTKEAEEVIEKWYHFKPEVIKWKRQIEKHMRRRKKTASLFGRNRMLPHILHHEVKHRLHSERAGINHKIQGSAADIVMLAMLRIAEHPTLQQWGFKLILQIHDEVILEGPREHGEEALRIVKDCMSNPFPSEGGNFRFRTQLVVDGKVGDTWYDCK